MLTENEQKVITILIANPHISLRGIIQELQLKGSKLSGSSVASIAYIINSLERKGFVRKVGVATTKHYQLTEKSYGFKLGELVNFEHLKQSTQNIGTGDVANFKVDSSVMAGLGGDNGMANFPGYLSKDFEGGSRHSDTSPNIGTFLSASITKIFDDPDSWRRYGDLIVWTVVLSVVATLSYKILGDQWFIGFISVALLLIIINKK